MAIRLFLFLGMIACFAWQSHSNFQKYVSGQSSMSESERLAKPEPLPSFSICPEPPFDNDFMNNVLGMEATFFLSSYLYALNKTYPEGLSENLSDYHSLHGFWSATSHGFQSIILFDPKGNDPEPDILVTSQIPRMNLSNYNEVHQAEVINSLWFGQCTSIVLKKPRMKQELLVLQIASYAEKVPKHLVLILHETPGSRYSLIPGDFLSSGSTKEMINFGELKVIGIDRRRKIMNEKRSNGDCFDYNEKDSQNLCQIKKRYLPCLQNETKFIETCNQLGFNVSRVCWIPQWANIWGLLDDEEVKQCTSYEEYACLQWIMDLDFQSDDNDDECLNPCTKMILESNSKTIDLPKELSNYAIVYLHYKSNYISVMEEYRIFDLASIIAAIGGSLGLFLGFSFFQCGSSMLYEAFDFMRRFFLDNN